MDWLLGLKRYLKKSTYTLAKGKRGLKNEYLVEHKIHAAGFARSSTILSKNQILFAIPNGGLRDQVEASKLKSEGVTRGIPDLFLAVPIKQYHGLFIEVKSEFGVISPDQEIIFENLSFNGYLVLIARTADEIVNYVSSYLRGVY